MAEGQQPLTRAEREARWAHLEARRELESWFTGRPYHYHAFPEEEGHLPLLEKDASDG